MLQAFDLSACPMPGRRTHRVTGDTLCAVVMRLKQAALFNDQSSKVMVASDAIGMGLNL